MFFVMMLVSASLAAQTPAKAPAAPAKSSGAASKAAPTNSRLLNPALFRARAPELYRAKFQTTKGDFTVEVTRANAPLGADRFYNLVKAGYFTGVSFYRVIAGAIVQFGINPSPAVTAAWSKAPIHDEPVKASNKPGAITFAKTDLPNSRTTQLFIDIGDESPLDAMGFAPIGTITEGMDVVKSLYSGYGEMAGMNGGRGPDQDLYTKQGKAYLDKGFPNLDSIKSASIIFPEAPATPAAPAKAAPKAATKK